MVRSSKQWIESFEIFEKYGYNDGLIAEHDEVWAGPDPEIVSQEDIARLVALGWEVSDTGNFHTSV